MYLNINSVKATPWLKDTVKYKILLRRLSIFQLLCKCITLKLTCGWVVRGLENNFRGQASYIWNAVYLLRFPTVGPKLVGGKKTGSVHSFKKFNSENNDVYCLYKVNFCLFVLSFNIPFHNFSVMSEQSHRFLGIKQYFRVNVSC